MRWDGINQRLVLESGEEIGGHAGALSIGPDGELLYGYDGVEDDSPGPALREEVGRYMAAFWMAWSEGRTIEEARRRAERAGR